MEKQNRENLVVGIKKAASTISTIMLIFGIIGTVGGAILLIGSLGTSLTTLISSIIMLIIRTPIENLILGFAQLVENSNVRTYKD